MKTLTIENFADFASFVNSLPFEYCLSRGQSDDFPLLPTALRTDEAGHRKYSRSSVDSFLDDFKIDAVHFIERPIGTPNELEWQVYAQHFGLPTRLLDFTYSHIISLMFAVEKAFSYDDDDDRNSVVWFLNPYELNHASIDERAIINISNAGARNLSSILWPVAISSQKINSRIAAQNGLFVLFPDKGVPLDSLAFVDDALIKVHIPHKAAKGILRTLYLMGIRFSSLYPELSSVSKDIMLKENVKKYIQNMEDNNE